MSDAPSGGGRGGYRPGAGRPVETTTIRKGEVYRFATPAGSQEVAVVEVTREVVTLAPRGTAEPYALERTARTIPRLDWAGLLDAAHALTTPPAEPSSREQALWQFERRIDDMEESGAVADALAFRIEGDTLTLYYDGFLMLMAVLHQIQVEPMRTLLSSRLTELE